MSHNHYVERLERKARTVLEAILSPDSLKVCRGRNLKDSQNEKK